jgi:hypothetical protein
LLFVIFALVYLYVLDMSTGKGKKRMKNVPVLYEENKKQRGVMLTDTAWSIAAIKAREENISVSELLERLLRKMAAG